MKISVIGSGYVGLVTGSCFSYVGNDVICVDIDKKKIKDLNNGKIPIFEDKLDIIINKSVKENRLGFTTDIEFAIGKTELIFLAVSTPMQNDGSSNLDYILQAAREIGKSMREHKIIIVKSTVPVGTTKLIKETIQKEIKDKSITFDIVNNPEFLKEGKAVSDFMHPDRIIVGHQNEKLKDLFINLYRPFSINHDKLIFMDIESSELTKYAANAMLAMKISFINEVSQLCEKNGADINDVRKGIGSDSRIGYSFIYPSIGFGGSCFHKDVNSLRVQFKKNGLTSLISKATLDVNELQWKNFVCRILNKFKYLKKNNRNIAVWGITFKPETDDVRESQAIKIIDKLLQHNFSINVYDPKGMYYGKRYYKDIKKVKFFSDKYSVLRKCDALILLTEWNEFRSPDFSILKRSLHYPIVFDGRNIYDKKELNSIGIEYFGIGIKNED